MNVENNCCNRDCHVLLAPGQVVYEVGPLRYCGDCVQVNVVRYPRLLPQQRRATRANALS